MPRVASLYLPYLSTDRLLASEKNSRRPEPALVAGLGKQTLAALREKEAEGRDRIADCSCPRGGGWRPGARWARERRDAEIAALPPHQRPPQRLLGRGSEAAENPFRSPPTLLTSRETGIIPAPPAPLVTAHRVGQKIEIAAVSPEAAVLGLTRDMALTHARMLVSALDVRDSDPAADQAMLQRLALLAARRWTPGAAVSGEDGLWLEIGAVAHLFGGEERMCARVLRFCARLGFSARIAVAATPGAAHALARHRQGPLILCPSGGEAEALAPLPLAALRIGEEVRAPASRLGLDRIGDLLAMPRAPLARRFGAELLLRLDQALGQADEPIDPVVPLDPPTATLRFMEPIATADAIAQVLGDLMPLLITALQEKGLAARTVSLVCARVDGEEQCVRIGTSQATRDGTHLLRLLTPKIETIDPGFGIEAMSLIATRSEPLGPQSIASVLTGEKPAPDLVPLIDRLAGRLGLKRIFRMSALESDVPERSLRRISPLDLPARWSRWPRPVRLLNPPEPVEQVMALLPDGAPRRFTWRGKTYAVRRADGPERVHGEWWRRRSESEAVRDYFQVEDESGARFWVFRKGDGMDGRTGDLSWWMQGMFG
jgi:protein ImuB